MTSLPRCPYLLQYRLVRSPLCPRHPQHPSPDPNFAGVNLLFHCLCLCPCFTAVQNPCREDHSLYNSHLCQLTHVLILTYFPYKYSLHCHSAKRTLYIFFSHPPSHSIMAPHKPVIKLVVLASDILPCFSVLRPTSLSAFLFFRYMIFVVE